MRRFLISIVMFWSLLFGHAAEPIDWANLARYAHANQELLAADYDPMRVVLMGNSITEFWEETHPVFFVNKGLVCRGIGGQVSSQMLARFRQDVLQLKPRVVVINCGTNDIAENNGPYNQDVTMDNIKSMTELARLHGIQVVLTSVLPCEEFCWNRSVKDAPHKIAALNKFIKEYATQAGVRYIDYYSAMAEPGGAMNKALTDDGVHPNAAGYDIMEALLTQMLDTLQ